MTTTNDDGAQASPSPGEAALDAALANHGEELAGLLDHTEDVTELIDLVVLTIAAADEDEVEQVTESLTHLIQAADAASTEETVALATAIGQHGSDTATALQTVLTLEQQDDLDDLVETASLLAELEIDDTTVTGLNRVLDSLAAAEETAAPMGIIDSLRTMWTPEGRAGLGYLIAVLQNLGETGQTE